MSHPPSQRQALGRGLAALLSSDEDKESLLADGQKETLAFIDIKAIIPSLFQPRENFDEVALQELAQSIKEHGILQPLLVLRKNHSEYTLIAGERRLRAAKMADLQIAPCRILELEDPQILEIALLENIQRHDLSPIEEAKGYQRLMQQFDYTQEKMAQKIGKSRSHIANILRILTLPTEVQRMIQDEMLSLGHAKLLLGASNPLALANKAVQEKLSVRSLEEALRKPSQAKKALTEDFKEEDHLAQQLSDILGLFVKLKLKPKTGGGFLTIHFEDAENLESFIERIHHAFSKE